MRILLLFFVVFSKSNLFGQIIEYKNYNFSSNTPVEIALEEIKPKKTNRIAQNNLDLSNGPTQDYVLIYLKIRNIDFKKYFLEISDSNLDSVYCYAISNNKLKLLGISGDWVADNNKSTNSLLPIFELDNIGIQEILLKIIKKEGGIKIPIKVAAEKEFTQLHSYNDSFAFFYLGTIFIFLLITVVFFIVLKEKLYLKYALFLFFWIFYYLSTYHYGSQYLWVDKPQLNDLLRATFASLVLYFYSNFTLSFLDFKKAYKKVYYFLKIITTSGLLFFLFAGPYSPFSKEINNWFFNYFNFITSFFVISIVFVSILLLKNGDKNVKVYWVAVLPIFAAVIITMAAENGFIIKNIFLKNLLWISSIIESTCFLVFITFRHKENLQEKIELEKDLVTSKLNLMKVEKEVSAKEKRQLAINLHDGTLPTLMAIKRNLEKNLDKNDQKNIVYLGEVIKQLRVISHELSPYSRKTNELELSIKKLLEIDVKIENKLKFDWNEANLSEQFKVDIYKIFAEIYSNALKHSKCDKINIEFLNKQSELNLIFSDNGIGFEGKGENGTGIGLSNIINQSNKHNGILKINSNINTGTTLTINFTNEQDNSRN